MKPMNGSMLKLDTGFEELRVAHVMHKWLLIMTIAMWIDRHLRDICVQQLSLQSLGVKLLNKFLTITLVESRVPRMDELSARQLCSRTNILGITYTRTQTHIYISHAHRENVHSPSSFSFSSLFGRRRKFDVLVSDDPSRKLQPLELTRSVVHVTSRNYKVIASTTRHARDILASSFDISAIDVNGTTFARFIE